MYRENKEYFAMLVCKNMYFKKVDTYNFLWYTKNILTGRRGYYDLRVEAL